MNRASLCLKYRDVLGDNTDATDPDLLRLLGGLDALSAENEPPASVVQSIASALDAQTSILRVQSAVSRRQLASSGAQSILARTRQWIDRRLNGMQKVAVYLLAAFTLMGATYAAMSVVDQAFYLDPSTRSIAEDKLGIELNQSKTIDGFTVSVKRVYADEDQVVVGYTISGPQGRTFYTFMASGALNKTPGPIADILPTLTDDQGNRLKFVGVAAAFDTGVQGGAYGQALRYDTPSIADGIKEISLHFEVGKITAYEQRSEGTLQAIMVPGPFEFSFAIPIESCCLKTQSH